MLRLIKPWEKQKLLDFYEKNPEMNVYLEYITRRFGLMYKGACHYGHFIRRKLCTVLISMSDVIMFAVSGGSDPEEIAHFINFLGRQTELCGPPGFIDALAPMLHEKYRRVDSILCALKYPEKLIGDDGLCEIYPIDINGARETYGILDASRTEGLYVSSYDIYELLIKNKLGNKHGRVYIAKHNGAAVSTAATNAETDTHALIGAVATHPSMRGMGFASRVVSRLCLDLLAEGKLPLLTHLSGEAGNMYERIGFIPVTGYSYLKDG